MTVEVRFKRGCKEFQLPEQETDGAAGFDLRYYGEKPVNFRTPGQVEMLDLGFSMELPAGYEAQIRPRSGLAAKYGITVLNAPGTVDADYRGPVKVMLVKSGAGTGLAEKAKPLPALTINPGDRVCQMVIQKVPEVKLMEVNELNDTERGEGGFGHTGVK